MGAAPFDWAFNAYVVRTDELLFAERITEYVVRNQAAPGD
jgi:hypothetical protein